MRTWWKARKTSKATSSQGICFYVQVGQVDGIATLEACCLWHGWTPPSLLECFKMYLYSNKLKWRLMGRGKPRAKSNPNRNQAAEHGGAAQELSWEAAQMISQQWKESISPGRNCLPPTSWERDAFPRIEAKSPQVQGHRHLCPTLLPFTHKEIRTLTQSKWRWNGGDPSVSLGQEDSFQIWSQSFRFLRWFSPSSQWKEAWRWERQKIGDEVGRV